MRSSDVKIVEDGYSIEDWFSNLKEKVDVWITDPPYPFDNKNGQNRFKYIDGEDHMYSRLDWNDLSNIFSKMYDETEEGGRIYVFADKKGLLETHKRMEEVGWKFRNYIIWDKERMGMGYHWRNSVEFIVYMTKGKPKTYIQGDVNLIRAKKPGKKDSIPEINYHPKRS